MIRNLKWKDFRIRNLFLVVLLLSAYSERGVSFHLKQSFRNQLIKFICQWSVVTWIGTSVFPESSKALLTYPLRQDF